MEVLGLQKLTLLDFPREGQYIIEDMQLENLEQSYMERYCP